MYAKMRTDAQLAGLYRGTVLPITRFRYELDPNGARPEVVDGLSEDLGLPVQGREVQARRLRSRGRFSFRQHMEWALLALQFGHYPFEQVGAIEDGRWKLKKLAPRPPYTLTEINIAKDGGLESIRQDVGWNEKPISVDRLVMYSWDREGGNWQGRSLFRDCYRSWVLKDILMRVDAIKHERNGIGTPVIEGPPGASGKQLEELNEMAQEFKADEHGGGAIPSGAKLTLQGTTGSLPDTIASIRFHNEEMARSFLMMFMQLGQTETGSRALGAEFIDFFAFAQESITDWMTGIFNEHVIEDWVDWNYGEEEPAPLLVYNRSQEEDLPVSALATLVEKGIVQVDEELEAAIRKRYKLPEAVEEEQPEPTPPEPPEPTPTPPEQTSPEAPPAEAEAKRRRDRVRATVETPSPLPLPDRDLRRQPYEQEVQAQVDYERLDKAWNKAVDKAVKAVSKLQGAQVAELADQIKDAAGDLTKLAELQAEPVAGDTILKMIQDLADEGIDTAIAEAVAQGVNNAKIPTTAAIEDALAARAAALDSVLARGLSDAAARRALALSGGVLDPTEVAEATATYLNSLTDSYLRDQLAGAAQQGLNSGRKLAIGENNATRVYASELLDEATCEECTAIDGTEYKTLDEAEADYPSGGYMECLGGPRCRGTLVAVYDEVPASEQS